MNYPPAVRVIRGVTDWAPSMARPEGASCASCGEREFALIPGAPFELWVKRQGRLPGRGHNDSQDPEGDMFVCLSCGRVELFVEDPHRLLERADPKSFPVVRVTSR